MSLREKIRELYVSVLEHDISVDEAMNQTDLMMEEQLGKDDKQTDDMPAKWNPALKKQWVNFRNHLRRELRGKYWG